jgi:hypothetical protein
VIAGRKRVSPAPSSKKSADHEYARGEVAGLACRVTDNDGPKKAAQVPDAIDDAARGADVLGGEDKFGDSPKLADRWLEEQSA